MSTALSMISTITLLKALCESPWTLPYAALLDPTGIFRRQNCAVVPPLATFLLEICCELRLAGRSTDADRLQLLASIDALQGDPTLQVVLSCARRLQTERRSINCFTGEQKNGSLGRQVFPEELGSSVRTMLFAEPVGWNDLNQGESRYSHEYTFHTKPFDYISGAVRFASEQSYMWLEAKHETRTGVVARKWGTEHIVCADEDFVKWIVDMSNPVNCCDATITSEGFTGSGDSSTQPANIAPLVQFVLVRCLGAQENDMHEFDERERRPQSKLGRVMLQQWDELSEESRHALLLREHSVAKRMLAQARLSSISGISNEITEANQRATLCGHVYTDVKSFAQLYTHSDSGRTMGAVVDFVEELCKDYFCAVHTAAHDRTIIESNRVWAVVQSAELNVSNMAVIGSIIGDIEQTDGSASSVINTILRAESNNFGDETVRGLLHRVSIPYLENVWDWVFDGSTLRDVSKDFFGTRLGLSVTDPEELCTLEEHSTRDSGGAAVFPDILTGEQCLFILRAGRSRALLKQCLPDISLLLRKPPQLSCLSENMDLYDYCGFLNLFSEHFTSPCIALDTSPISSAASSSSASASNESSNSNVKQAKSAAQGSLDFDGRETHTLTVADEIMPVDCFQISVDAYDMQQSSRRGRITLFSSSIDPYLDNDVSTTENEPVARSQLQLPVAVLYRDALLEPLRIVDEAVQRRILGFFAQELQVFAHFKNLRSHVLLGAGDFANILVEQINSACSLSEEDERYIQRRTNAAMSFYGTTGPGMRSTRDRTHLNRCLVTALNLSSFENERFAGCLTLDANASQSVQKRSLWDGEMDMRYDIKFPLTMMFSTEAMEMYSLMFDFLLRIHRAKKSLRNLYMISRRNSVLRRDAQRRALSDRHLRVLLWQFCYQADHFVSILGGFELDQVLGSRWLEFERSWTLVKSIWELRDSHMNYLNDCIRRCMLGEKHRSVLGVMSGGFDIVVKMEKLISSMCHPYSFATRSTTKDTKDHLVSASASLRRRLAFLSAVLERLLEGGTHSYLQDLQTRLNLNNYYDRQKG